MTTAQTDVVVSADQLVSLAARLFVAVGVPPAKAQTVAGALVDADLEGLPSHGVMLVDMYIDRIRRGSVSAEASGIVVSDKDATVVIDARNALGQVTADHAMALAIERARQFGAGVVAVRNGFHFGAARRYAVQASQAGCVGIAMCNTRPLMPAPGGAERVVGNNPIAISFPSNGPVPIVLDMATSEAAMGKIRLAEKAGAAIPPNWAVKADGSPTTHPADAISGMLLPSAGPKGFGLAFLIDLMCGALSGGGMGSAVQPLYGDFATPYNCSHLFIAIDIARFGEPQDIRAAASKAAEKIRGGKRAPGVAQLFTPGEPEWRKRERAEGNVRLPPPVAGMLARVAAECNVSASPLVPEPPSSKEARHGQA